jgi:hypothetical protein
MVATLLAALIASGIAQSASAVTVIPAANRVDMVHDAKRDLVYVTNGTEVLRYQVSTGTLLPSISLGGDLAGVDLSPDGNTLVVADRAGSAANSWVYLVALDTLAVTQASVPKAAYEGGMFTAVYGADGNVYTTSTYQGSGWIPLRQYATSTGQWTTLASVRQNTMLSPSGDTQTIAFAEANTSDGAWGLIDIPTGQIVRRQGYTDGTSWFNYEIAADRLGAQFAIPTYGGTFVYNAAYQKTGTLGVYAGAQPIGVAFHPVEQTAYFPWTGSTQVRVYDMNALSQTGAYDFGDTFNSNGNNAFVQGRTRISRDGSLLMVSVTGGVGIQSQYAPLSAGNVAASTNAGQAVNVALQGAIGNNGALSYEITTVPTHGSVTVNGAVATYTPAAGFSGNDTFGYRVHYGRAYADATAALTVIQPNRNPVAVNDTAVAFKSSILIPVLANDSDPDGDALTIVSVTRPARGAASIQGNQILFTPPNGAWTPVTFSYTISDGRGGSASASVTVSRAR